MSRWLGPGGTERQLAETAKWLQANEYPVHAACFFGGGIRADELRGQSIPILELPVRSLTDGTTLSGFRLLGRYLRQHRIQIVHPFDFSSDIFAAPAARWFRTPVVLTSQRCFLDTIPPKYHRLLRFSHALAHGVVANCDAVRRHLISGLRVPERKIQVCYNGLDTAAFHAGGRAPGQNLVIGTASVLRPEKRLDLLLHAFAKVHRANPGTRLLIVGEGEERSPLESLAVELNIRSVCSFQPAVSDVAPWLRSMDVFVLPSRSEALSNSLMEAMACQCCVIASRVGGNPELVTDGETGLLFTSEAEAALTSQLTAVVENPELRARLAAAAARKMAETFSLAKAGQAMEQVYRHALARI